MTEAVYLTFAFGVIVSAVQLYWIGLLILTIRADPVDRID